MISRCVTVQTHSVQFLDWIPFPWSSSSHMCVRHISLSEKLDAWKPTGAFSARLEGFSAAGMLKGPHRLEAPWCFFSHPWGVLLASLNRVQLELNFFCPYRDGLALNMLSVYYHVWPVSPCNERASLSPVVLYHLSLFERPTSVESVIFFLFV